MQVGVLGASGMIGVQLMRLLKNHPQVDSIKPFSKRLHGTPVSALHPSLRDLSTLKFEFPSLQNASQCHVMMMCLGDYSDYLPLLRELKIPLIDLGSGFRLSSPERYAQVHGRPHVGADLFDRFVTVIPELNATHVQENKWVASQGCVSTSVALVLQPLIQAGLLADDFVIVDAKVGSTGAGNSGSYSQMHFNRCNGVKVYRLLDEHRHSQELQDFLFQTTGKQIGIHVHVFSVDLIRGISSAIYVRLKSGTEEKTLRRVFNSAYKDYPTVRVLKLAAGEERYPNPRWLNGSGFCEIGFRVDPNSGRAVFISALDNLMKGGASQGLQLLNLIQKWDAHGGIPLATSYP